MENLTARLIMMNAASHDEVYAQTAKLRITRAWLTVELQHHIQQGTCDWIYAQQLKLHTVGVVHYIVAWRPHFQLGASDRVYVQQSNCVTMGVVYSIASL